MQRPTLEQITNIAIIVTCVAALGVFATREMRRITPESAAATFKVGEPGPQLEGVTYGDHRKTLVMFLRSTCGYCTESMPFYRTLNGISKSTDGLRLVVASGDPVDVSKEYLRTHNVSVDSVVVTPRTVPTPTLVLVDQSGKVRDVWLGRQTPDRERDIVEKLKQGQVQARVE